MNIIPEDDPNEAYEVIPMPDHPRGPHGWWTVTCNGIDDRHFHDRAEALRYATDPALRAEIRGRKKLHEH